MRSQSKQIAMACCRFHNDRTPSMGIYENWDTDGRIWYTYYCFGCMNTGLIPRNEIKSWLADSARLEDEDRELKVQRADNFWTETESLLEPIPDTARQFLEDRAINVIEASRRGVRYHHSLNAFMWQCKRWDGGIQAIQLRYIEPSDGKKIITYPHMSEDTIFPKHAVLKKLDTRKSNNMIISESYLDGVALHQHTGCLVFTTLSSNFNQGHVGLVNHIGTSCGITRIVLAYDMDDAGLKAETHMSRFLNALGFRVIRMSQDLTKVEFCGTFKPYHKPYINAVKEKIV